MSLRSGVREVPPEVGLGTRTVVIAAIDPTFHATVSEARHLLDAFSFVGRLMCDGLLRKFVPSRALTQANKPGRDNKKMTKPRWKALVKLRGWKVEKMS